MKVLDDLKLQFGAASALYRLMIINIVLFLVIMLAETIFFLFRIDRSVISTIVSWLTLPADPQALLFKPWTLITYMFLHVEVLHILINMLILFWTGKLFTEYLGNDKLWATYILGGLTGGFFYLAAFSLFPAFESHGSGQLLGASAGVIAVLVGIATLLPDYTVQLLIFGSVRLKYIAMVSILLYAISIPHGNAGGHIAHLGGALFGFLMVKQLKKGRDLTAWLVKMAGRKKNPVRMKVVSKRGSGRDDIYREKQVATQENIDRILDKINRSGFDSLTREEKDILYKASGKNP